MDPEDLVGTEVVAVYMHHNYFTIIFDNGHEVDVSAPVGGNVDDAIHESGE
jgi:ABC-type uncharacterized transport system substrate-binding protein